MIAAEGIVVRLDGRTVLDGVSLGVAPGELVSLVGPNGAGKSTLLRVLAGLIRPQAGSVMLNGATLAGLSPRARARCSRAPPWGMDPPGSGPRRSRCT